MAWYGMADNRNVSCALSEAFRANACPHLEKLELNCDNMSIIGVRALADAFQAGGCPLLKELHICCECYEAWPCV